MTPAIGQSAIAPSMRSRTRDGGQDTSEWNCHRLTQEQLASLENLDFSSWDPSEPGEQGPTSGLQSTLEIVDPNISNQPLDSFQTAEQLAALNNFLLSSWDSSERGDQEPTSSFHFTPGIAVPDMSSQQLDSFRTANNTSVVSNMDDSTYASMPSRRNSRPGSAFQYSQQPSPFSETFTPGPQQLPTQGPGDQGLMRGPQMLSATSPVPFGGAAEPLGSNMNSPYNTQYIFSPSQQDAATLERNSLPPHSALRMFPQWYAAPTGGPPYAHSLGAPVADAASPNVNLGPQVIFSPSTAPAYFGSNAYPNTYVHPMTSNTAFHGQVELQQQPLSRPSASRSTSGHANHGGFSHGFVADEHGASRRVSSAVSGVESVTEVGSTRAGATDVPESASVASPSNMIVASSGEESDIKQARSHLFYQAAPQADGLYHCPYVTSDNCSHRPTKLKCNYDKYIDSHVKPFRCKVVSCEVAQFSSTACLLRHEREAHGMHGHGEKPHLCLYPPCLRSQPGHGFPRKFNWLDHMKRQHHYVPPTAEPGSRAEVAPAEEPDEETPEPPKRQQKRKRKAVSKTEGPGSKRPKVKADEGSEVFAGASLSPEQAREQQRQQMTEQWRMCHQLLLQLMQRLQDPADTAGHQQIKHELEVLETISHKIKDLG